MKLKVVSMKEEYPSSFPGAARCPGLLAHSGDSQEDLMELCWFWGDGGGVGRRLGDT